MKKIILSLLFLAISIPAFAGSRINPFTGKSDFTGVDQQNTDCSANTGEGYLCWDTDNDILYIGDGTTANAYGIGDITTVGDVTSGAAFAGAQGNSLQFEGSVADGFETTLTAANPSADGAVTIPAVTGTIITTGDTGTVTGTMILDSTVALTTDTSGNYVSDIAGTSNEISVSHTPAEGSTGTISLPSTIDIGGKTSFEIPNAAAPTVDVFGELAGDNNIWAASRGAPIFYDGTASTALVNVLVSDTPANGEVPKWNTGGTITWETDGGGSGAPFADTTSIVEGNGDATKEIRFEVDGLTTGTIRVLTPPDKNFTIIASGDTFTGDVTATLDTDGSTALTIAADSVALTTDTTGNYVANASTSVLTGLTGGSAGSEAASLSLAFDYSQALSGDVGLGGNATVFGVSGFVTEGATANTFEGFGAFADITADRTWTFPDRTGTVILSGDTFTGDVTATLDTDGGTALTIAADSVALTTDTTGNYVASANTSVLTGLTGGSAGSEGAALSLAFDYSQALSGDVGLGANATVFGVAGLVTEGATANTFEGFIAFTDITADRTWTLPDRTGTVILSGDTTSGDVTGTLESDGDTALTIAANSVALTTDTTGNYVANASTSVLTGLTGGSGGSEGASLSLAFDYSQALSGDVGLAADNAVFGVSGLVFEGTTANTSEAFISVTDPTADRTYTLPDRGGTVSLSGDTLTGDVTATLESDGSTATTIAANSVALSTDTTGNYVLDVADGTGIDGTAAAEGATYTPTLDLTEISSTTLGAGAFTTMTFDAGTADPRLTAANKTLTFTTVNGTNNEDLTFDFDTTANDVDVTTSTGVTQIQLNSIDLVVPTEAYDATNWNGDNSVPTKDAVRDKIETISGSTWTTVVKASDETISSDSTLSNDSALQFSMAASTNYAIKIRVKYTTHATPDFQYSITGPASPTRVVAIRRHNFTGTVTNVTGIETAFDFTAVALTGGTTPTYGFIEIDVIVQNGSNAGTFAFQWSQVTLNANNTTVYEGSYLEYTTT